MNTILKDMWTKLDEDEKSIWRKWEEWDAQRFERDLLVFKKVQRRKNKLSGGVVEESVNMIDHGKKSQSRNDGSATKTHISSSEPKGKRTLEEYSSQAETIMDISKASIPKRRKSEA